MATIRPLHADQIEMFESIKRNILEIPEGRGVAMAPPGFGKTSVITAVMDYVATRNRHGVSLMLTPRILLNAQQQQELEEMEIVGMDNIPKKVFIFDSDNNINTDMVREFVDECYDSGYYPIVVSTYTSCGLLSGFDFDVICCDEGHNLTQRNFFNSVMWKLKKENRRVFFTATPKIGFWQNKHIDDENKLEAESRGMDNENVYGKFVYKMSFSRAVNKGLILPFKRVTLDGYGRSKASENIVDLVIHATKCMQQTIKSDSDLPAKVIFVIQTVEEIKTICEHSERIKKETGVDVYTAFSQNESYHKNGVLFKKGSGGNRKKWFMTDVAENNNDFIICHHDTMGEGIDVPGITGCVLFPTDDVVRIIQNLGRAMRVLPEDRNKPRHERRKQYAYMGTISYNGENSSQEFQNGLAEALHQMDSDTFLDAFLTAVLTDGASAEIKPGVIESIKQNELLAFEHSDVEEIKVFDSDFSDIPDYAETYAKCETELKQHITRRNVREKSDRLKARLLARKK